jgi:hypothetical protein
MDFEPGVVQRGSEFSVRELLEDGPVVIPPYSVL